MTNVYVDMPAVGPVAGADDTVDTDDAASAICDTVLLQTTFPELFVTAAAIIEVDAVADKTGVATFAPTALGLLQTTLSKLVLLGVAVALLGLTMGDTAFTCLRPVVLFRTNNALGPLSRLGGMVVDGSAGLMTLSADGATPVEVASPAGDKLFAPPLLTTLGTAPTPASL